MSASLPAKPVFLFWVADAFFLSGRGLILVPEIASAAKYYPGDSVLLIKPSSEKMEVRVKAIDYLLYKSDSVFVEKKLVGIVFNDTRDILLGPEMRKEDVPIGTEVWLKTIPIDSL